MKIGGRDQSDASTNLEISGNHQKLGEKQGTVCPSKPPEGTNHVDSLGLEFWPPGL